MKKKFFIIIILIFSLIFAYAQNNKKKNNEGIKKQPVVILKKKPKTKQELQKEVEDLKADLEDLKKKVDKIDETTKKNKLSINGVFDVNVSNYQNRPNIFDIGNFELHLEHSYKNHFQVAAAIVFNRGAELRVGFIDYHVFGGKISPRGRLFAEKGIHIQVGKFDVPVGNDWQYFVSSERITVTPPITTESIMGGGYNDVGIRILGSFAWINFSVYALRGIEAGYTWNGNSVGARIAFTPFTNPYTLKAKSIPLLEIGVSYIQDFDRAGQGSERVISADIESKKNLFLFRAEYIRRDKTSVGLVYDGTHATIGFDLETMTPAPMIIYMRYGFYMVTRYKGVQDEQWIHRVTGGLNFNISHISFIKLEYIRYLNYFEDYMVKDYFNENLFYLQLVITF